MLLRDKYSWGRKLEKQKPQEAKILESKTPETENIRNKNPKKRKY